MGEESKNTQIGSSDIWQEVSDPEKIDQFIIEKFSKQISTVKGHSDTQPRAKFVSRKPNHLFIIKLDNVLEFPQGIGTLYSNMDRQIELDFKIIQSKDDMLLIQPTLLKLAEYKRRSERIGNIRGKVTATNFLISKEDIEESKLYGVTSNVLLQDIHKRIVPLNLNSRILGPKDNEFSEEMELCFQKNRIIFILDTLRMVSYKDPSVMDAKAVFEEELILEEKIAEYKKKKISSILIYPLSIPFGERKQFVNLVATRETLGIEPSILDLYKKVEELFLERIMDSNTQTIDTRQNVVNASLQGLGLEITDERIRKALKLKPSFTIDLNFKMQQPLRVALEAKHIKDCGEYDLVGAEIMGFSGDVEGGRKYNSFLDFIQKI